MHKGSKTVLWLSVPVCILLSFFWAAASLRRGVISAYYEWGVTGMIAAYAEEHGGIPPSDWGDLVGYEYHSKYLPDPRTIESASQHVIVDFSSLMEFQKGTIGEFKLNVIKPLRGFEIHWINPKLQLEAYFRDHRMPNGAMSRKDADYLRDVWTKQPKN